MTRFILLTLLTFVIATPVQAKSFINAQEIVSESGIKAWFVQDKTVPVIAISMMFKGGASTDPAEKSGLANLASTLMDEGAGDLNAQAFQKSLKDHAIQFSFSAGRDGFYGQMKTTVTHQKTAFDLLKKSLTMPSFDTDAINRMRTSLLTSIRYDAQDAGWHAQKSLLSKLYGNHPYARQIKGTPQTLQSITRADLVKYHQQTITRDNLIIGIAGDIAPTDAVALLDEVFAALPKTSTRPAVPLAALNFNSDIIYTPWDGPQSVIMMAQKGIARRDPNWFTAQIINYILGGGGFSSRLMQELRVKRGLTYGISTGIIDYQYGPILLGQASVARDKADDAIAVIRDEWQRLIQHGITAKELRDAKAYLIGSLPLSLNSTDSIATVLVQMQEDGLPIDYLDFRGDEINAIRLDDLNNFAKIWLNSDHLTIAVAGTKNNE